MDYCRPLLGAVGALLSLCEVVPESAKLILNFGVRSIDAISRFGFGICNAVVCLRFVRVGLLLDLREFLLQATNTVLGFHLYPSDVLIRLALHTVELSLGVRLQLRNGGLGLGSELIDEPIGLGCFCLRGCDAFVRLGVSFRRRKDDVSIARNVPTPILTHSLNHLVGVQQGSKVAGRYRPFAKSMLSCLDFAPKLLVFFPKSYRTVVSEALEGTI
jgi:hypothetical protein